MAGAELASGRILQVQPVPVPAQFDSMIQSWDMAFKDKATSDYVVGQVWGAKGAFRFPESYALNGPFGTDFSRCGRQAKLAGRSGATNCRHGRRHDSLKSKENKR
jgi:hypothetical protein